MNVNMGRNWFREAKKIKVESPGLRMAILVACVVVALIFVLAPNLVFGSYWDALKKNYLLSLAVRYLCGLFLCYLIAAFIWLIDLKMRKKKRRT